MLAVDCPGHGGRVLVALDGLEAVRNTAVGIEVWWRCPCGTRGVACLGRPARRSGQVSLRAAVG